MKISTLATIVATITLISTSSAFAGTRVRVAHLSPDAPPVDVRVNGDRLISALEFGQISDYLFVAAGEFLVQVSPAGAIEPVVIDANLTLKDGQSYTVAATGLLGEEDLSPIVVVDDAETTPEGAKARFVHASPDAPPVDIAVVDGDVVFASVPFRGISDVQTLPAGEYPLEVRVAGTDTVALDLGTVTLKAGSSVTFFATGLLSDETLAATSAVTATTEESPALVRVAHLSPDAPNVDVWVDGARTLFDVPFTAVSAYLALDAGEHRIQVTPAGTDEPIVIDATVGFAAGEAYTVAATGLLGDDDLAPIVLIDNVSTDSENASVRFVHASADAPAVDIAVMDGPVLIADRSFREGADAISVPAGSYDLEVRVAGTETVALSLPGVELAAGVNISVFAIGLLADETLAALPVVDVDDRFTRGDANRDKSINIADPVSTLIELFVASVDNFCPDAADVDDDGHVTLTDAILSLDFMFNSGADPQQPFPTLGTDATEDNLACTRL